MADRVAREPAGGKGYSDSVLIASILLLTGIGLVTLYSSSYTYANREFGNGLYFISRQLMLGMIGLALFVLASLFPLKLLRKWMQPIVVITLLLCILTLFPGIGVTKNGASRWIRFGASTYQPSELVKLVLPLYLAHIFDKKYDQMHSLSSGLVPPTLITTLFFVVIYFQNNISTALFIVFNALFMFFLAGVRIRFFIGAGVILFPLSSFLVLTKEHRLRRLISFIWPDWEPLGAGFQVRSSLLTISSGGILGKGIGQGTRKNASVPEIQSDFIFSSYAEEFGFIGVLLFYLVIAGFAIRGYQAALQTDDRFKRLLACGLVTIIISQTLINIAVVSGALPATGIPLPFFSAGGSSLATTLTIAGFIVNISRHTKEPGASRV